MHFDVHAITRHPYIAAGAVFGVGLIWLIAHRSGGGGTQVAMSQTGPSPAQIQAAGALQVAQTNGSFALASQQAQVEGAKQLATIAAGVQTTALTDALTAQMHSIDAQMSKDSLTAAIESASLGVQSHIADLQAGLQSQQLSNEHAATQKDYLLQYHAQNVQDNVNAWNYTLAYQKEQDAATTNAGLISVLDKLALPKAA